MFRDFFKGVSFIARGWNAFFRDKKTWRYALIPWLLMSCIYAVAVYAVFFFAGKISEMLAESFANLPSWLGSSLNFIITAGGAVIVLLLLSTAVCFVYELLGSLFFDALTGYYEHKKYGTLPRKMSFSENLRYAVDSLSFGIRSAMIFGVLFICSLIIPFAGQIIMFLIMGYYFGISYMISTAVNSHFTVKQLEKLCSGKTALVTGFGTAAYLLLTIPLTTLFVLPALVLGASELFNEEIKKGIS